MIMNMLVIPTDGRACLCWGSGSPVGMLVNAKYMYGGFKLSHFQNLSVVTFNQFEVLETEDQKHRVYLKFVYARGCKKNYLIV